MHKKTLLFVLFVAFFSFFIYANNNSDALYNSFIKQNIIPEKQPLLSTENTLFPYNVIIYSNNKVNLLISVEDALNCTEQLANLANYFNIICTVNNKSTLDFSEYSCNGLQTFLEKSSFSQNPILIVETSNFTSNSTAVQVVPGTKGFVTSKYCLEKLLNTFNKNDQSFRIKDKSISAYKLGFVENDEQLSFLFAENLNVVKLQLSNNLLSKIIPSLEDFATNYDIENTENNDVNFALLSGFNTAIFMSEFTLTLIFIISVGTALLFICLLSFMFGKKGQLRKKIMLKYWMIAPLFLVSIVVFLYFSQFIVLSCFQNYESNMILAYIAKLCLTGLFLCLLFVFIKELKLPHKSYAYSYLIPIVSLVNIFIFSAIYLPLLPLFIAEFFIVYFTQKIKNTYLLIFVLILMLMPFFPTSYSLFSGINPQSLHIFVKSNLLVNTLNSFLSLPFVFLARRILLSIKVKSQQKTKTSSKRYVVFIKIGVLLILGITTVFILRGANSKTQKDLPITETQTERTINDNLFDVNIVQEQKFSTCKNIVTINSEQNVDLYTVKITSSSDFPIYIANFPFEYNLIQHYAFLKLAENPPNPLQIEFLTDLDSEYIIEIEGFAKTENSVETKMFNCFVPGNVNGSVHFAR